MFVRRRLIRRMLLALALVQASAGKGAVCGNPEECQAHMASLVEKLDVTTRALQDKQVAVRALEELRAGVVGGERIELPSARRQHLERGSPLVNEISYDARHRPISNNVTRHFQFIRTVAPEARSKLHTFLILRRSSGQKGGPSAVIVSVDFDARLNIYSIEGETLVKDFDLGHAPGHQVTQLVLSPSQDNHFVVTADDLGVVRVHALKVVARGGDAGRGNSTSEKAQAAGDAGGANTTDAAPEGQKAETKKVRQLSVSAELSCTFSVPPSASGETRELNAVLPVERGSQMYFVTGDSLGGISVFYKNGTMKGRIRVSEDPGGVKGLLRSQGQMVLYWSSHSFGFFAATQIEVQFPPCNGWNSPLFDVALESSSSNRVVLALNDGDILVFSTARGKSKVCELALKFPHVSTLPFKLSSFRGHILGIQTPLEDTYRKDEYLRELYFFNMAAMEAGYGTSPSRAVTLQASFRPRQPERFAAQLAPGTSSGGDRSKSLVALQFEAEGGIHLYDLTLKQPPAPKAQGPTAEGDNTSWFNWIPKIGVFGVALVGVVIWNVRKVTTQRQHDRMDDFDEDYFKERLKERREKKKLEQAEQLRREGKENVDDTSKFDNRDSRGGGNDDD